ncbi:hypothetical protein pdam_00021204 [Pocillopora damicornis]|uniref:Uncharacterized protein n=1 Tax=Pocillopora damicornis TaxID=46731 RepID=A0A3M6USR8_POCDA|nr:hypothetical protein pdam_00021204 [Pocillopora damicornis]
MDKTIRKPLTQNLISRSVLKSFVRTVLLVKIFLEVTDASVNLDILDETVKLMWTSAQVLLAKTVLYVKMFPAVIDAVVNQDLQAETVKEVCGLKRPPFTD